MTTVDRPRGQGRNGSSVTQGDAAELAGEQLSNSYPGRAVNLGRSTALSTKAAPRRGEVPHSASTEQRLIGCVLIDEWECWGEEVERIIAADDFFLPEHQAIWQAFRWSFERGWPVTIQTTAYALSEMAVLEKVDEWVGEPGTEAYLVMLQCREFSAIGSEAYARIIKDYAERRKMLTEAQKLARAAHEPRETWKTLAKYEDEV